MLLIQKVCSAIKFCSQDQNKQEDMVLALLRKDLSLLQVCAHILMRQCHVLLVTLSMACLLVHASTILPVHADDQYQGKDSH